MTSRNRRDFLKTSALLAGGLALPTIVPASALGRGGRTAPSDRITLGFIGTGNMGTGHVRQFLEKEAVHIAAVCDVNQASYGYWNGAYAGRDPARHLVNFRRGQEMRSGNASPCDGIRRLSGAAGSRRYRRRSDFHAGSLARHSGDCRGPRREAYLRRETAFAYRPGRAGYERCGEGGGRGVPDR